MGSCDCYNFLFTPDGNYCSVSYKNRYYNALFVSALMISWGGAHSLNDVSENTGRYLVFLIHFSGLIPKPLYRLKTVFKCLLALNSASPRLT